MNLANRFKADSQKYWTEKTKRGRKTSNAKTEKINFIVDEYDEYDPQN